MKKERVFKVKNYPHFDNKKNNYKKYIPYVMNKESVEKHPFFPFIHYTDKRRKYNGEECQYKEREIYYASHIDRYIYQYYSYLLNERYNRKVKKLGLNRAVIAYRTNLHKSNIHFAHEVMMYLKEQKEAFIIVSDFSNFFDTLNHEYLKQNIKYVLEKDSIPIDLYKVLKNVCKFSYIELEDILKEINIEEKELSKINRFFEIKEFRKIKKKLLNNNKEDFGIVQGSPISAVLSNIYMIKFDSLINNLITSHNGIYRRYSDDIFIAIPNIEQGKQICNQIKILVNSIPNLKLSEKKTKYLVKCNASIDELNKENLEIINKNAKINYLGFSYDGNKIKIIEKTVSKFYTKMYARVKTINRYSNKRNRNIGRRKIYKQYSHLGANTKKIKEGNFLSYVNRAKDIFKEDAEFNRQVRNAWKNLNKRLDNVNSKRGE